MYENKQFCKFENKNNSPRINGPRKNGPRTSSPCTNSLKTNVPRTCVSVPFLWQFDSWTSYFSAWVAFRWRLWKNTHPSFPLSLSWSLSWAWKFVSSVIHSIYFIVSVSGCKILKVPHCFTFPIWTFNRKEDWIEDQIKFCHWHQRKMIDESYLSVRPWIIIQMSNPPSVEGWAPPDDAVHGVSLVQEKLCQVWSILAFQYSG